MGLNFGKMQSLFGKHQMFSASPNDFDIMHWEGGREVPGAAGSIETTSYASPGTMANDAAVGDDAWDNPDNAKASDDSNADCTHFAAIPWTTNYLKATNFGFTIPTGATILGIEVQIEHTGDFANEIRDIIVKLVEEGGAVAGDDHSNAQAWSTTEETFSYGSSSDLWGHTWTAANINNSNFGVVLSAEVYSGGGGNTLLVDHIQMKITYQTN